MFTEVREMIDSTVYTNGRSEVTAQNVNLAMHGIIDATEDKLEEVEGNISEITTDIDELKVQIEESANSAVGLTFQFPMMLLEMLELPGMSATSMELSPEVIELIGQEIPSWVEPLNNMVAENQRVYSECLTALENGKDMPILSVNVGAGIELAAALEGAVGVTSANISYKVNPTVSMIMNYSGMSQVVLTLDMDGISGQFMFVPSGYAVVEANSIGYFDIPAPGMEAIDNGGYISCISSYAYSNRYHEYTYVYASGYYDKCFITPLIVTQDETNMYVRFLSGLDILEGVINLTDGMTTSRIVGSITPTN